MGNLVGNFGLFGDQYDGMKMRSFIAELERTLRKVSVDGTETRSTATGTVDITSADNLILCDTSSADVTVNLPQPDNALVLAKHKVNVKKESANNILYIVPTGGAGTDFRTDTLVIRNRGTSLCFRAVEDGWRIV